MAWTDPDRGNVMLDAADNVVELAFDETGEGAPLLLLHGTNADRGQFASFRPLLGPGIRAIALDQRDSPDSPCAAEPYGMADHARDIAHFVERHGLGRVHLFGSSYGGTVAASFAIHYPELTASLVLGATASSFDQFHAPDLQKVRAQGADAVRRFMLEVILSPEAISAEPTLATEAERLLLIREPAAFARRGAAVEAYDIRDSLQRITAPALVICGDQDPLIRVEEARRMADAIPDGRFELLPGSRHGITLQNRERTARIVREFVLSHS